MHIGIITYQTGHLMTLQLLMKLQQKNMKITIFAFPFVKRPKEKIVFPDRPEQILDFDLHKYCSQNNIDYVEVNGWSKADSDLMRERATPDYYLTCIAKIIPDFFLERRIILNTHPGLLPNNRGVDAFKWAVLNGDQLGVTLHIIDKDIDCGKILKKAKVPIFKDDNFYDVAKRSYYIECDLLANFDYHISAIESAESVSNHSYLSKKKVPDYVNMEEEFFKSLSELIKQSELGI